ncbi:anaerobic ribonucleoside-triphosphate reductase activating protein [Colibacter massiliensis]|uniref:anaerobic ribonucleoside-triphosphate reductase activating protein n=1 Tax=Colibacter massiliensis TaxID=1852379 RepID=UPI00094E0AEE|nr:anaerobic ribonucleoside-triphosphate reductase activating protein [Colibacter massiliensis]
MKYGQIRKMDIANGPGIRTSVFVTGCTHNCFNCFNKEYQNPNFGTDWTDAETERIIGYLKEPAITGLTLLGGEPMQNTEGLIPVIKAVRKAVETNIWVYSGYVYEELVKDASRKKLLSLCDVLVDGPFKEDLKDPGLFFRGSANQRVIAIPATLAAGEVTLLWPDGR